MEETKLVYSKKYGYYLINFNTSDNYDTFN